jgi:hypothetical protein
VINIALAEKEKKDEQVTEQVTPNKSYPKIIFILYMISQC